MNQVTGVGRDVPIPRGTEALLHAISDRNVPQPNGNGGTEVVKPR